jgi:tetraacyldisaccharide 4'-kinase
VADTHPVERVWSSDTVAARVARITLMPFAALYGALAAGRRWLYQRGVFRSGRGAVPIISVGNLTVGGTGKTPVAAWIAARLRERGGNPAIVLRGYGADEPEVHRILNPDVPVIIGADRRVGVATAARQGADIAVLDDAFQHLAVVRDADVVLVSAEQWGPVRRLLPAGPWREPISALRRASLVVITSRIATPEDVERISDEICQAVPNVRVATLRLEIEKLVCLAPRSEMDLSVVLGKEILAIAGVGNSQAFFRQLETCGAKVVARSYRDHHAYTRQDAQDLARAAQYADVAVCTLKDAVKLAPLWPAEGPPLWYVLQAVHIERGEGWFEELFDTLLARRTGASPMTSGMGRPNL